MLISDLPAPLVDSLRDGVVIPAVPLALFPDRQFDERRQKALVRYYIDAGVGGLAAGVHTTQFAIRAPGIDLFEKVLASVSSEIDSWSQYRSRKLFKIAGVCGRTDQALREAATARDLGYHACLLSLSSFPMDEEKILIQHCRQIANVMPVFGFYLQPAVGGRLLAYQFWRAFVEIENVLAIKIAPFNRYQTLDVLRAVAESGRGGEIALYTGNDDSILLDLLTPYIKGTPSGQEKIRVVGGLLGQWAVWTSRAVEMLDRVKTLRDASAEIPEEMLTEAAVLTEANGAIFDAANNFAGCIPGIHYVLQGQGLLAGTWCLDPDEKLSPSQDVEIDRVRSANPWLTDDEFVRDHLHEWLD